jgi:hypothetical protein
MRAAALRLGSSLSETRIMSTKDLRELRHKYKSAYTSYMHCVHALSDATEHGVWPSPEIVKLESQALNDLTSLRQALLDALYAHAVKGGSNSK